MRTRVVALAFALWLAAATAHAASLVATCYPVYVTLLNLTRGVEGVSVARVGESAVGCVHNYQLTTADWRKLERADLIVVNGGGLEPFADKLDPGKVVNASANMASLDDNPHVWLSATSLQMQVMALSEALSRRDPGHAAAYRRNAREYTVRLVDLQGSMTRTLAGVRDRKLIVCSDAFGLFAQDLGFTLRELDEPRPRELGAAIDEIRREGKRFVLTTDENAALAQLIARETGVAVCELDAILNGANDDPDAYLKAMRRNADIIRDAAIAQEG